MLWLTPLHGSIRAAAPPAAGFTLAQRNKEFVPHLLIIPVGSVVHFPNQDPFFHNVFSLFEGRRFDLGLYEAGTSRDINFPREGVSYIFCNIHPEMSAVVIALSTSYFSAADGNGRFRVQHVTPGTYAVHVWLEGEDPAVLESLTRTVQVKQEDIDLGVMDVPDKPVSRKPHTNKFGLPYQVEDPALY